MLAKIDAEVMLSVTRWSITRDHILKIKWTELRIKLFIQKLVNLLNCQPEKAVEIWPLSILRTKINIFLNNDIKRYGVIIGKWR